jgi:hypothetical protein
MAGKVDGDRLDLELACDLNRQGCPGIDVSARVVQQECSVVPIAPTEPAQYRTPGQISLNCLGAGCRAVAYVPHSLCL